MKKIRSQSGCRFSTRSGAAVVEFAFTVPVVFMLIFGALELGHANMIFNVSEAAAYEGAREGIVPGATSGEVIAATQNILDISSIKGATITVTPNNLSVSSTKVRVDINVPYAQNTLMPPFFTQGMVIQRSCELTREDAS